MQAVVYHGRNDVRYETFPDPDRVGPRQVRLKVKWASLCHTDFNEYLHGPLFIARTPHPRTGRSIPLVMGHEFSGEVVEVGNEVERLRAGDRVAINAVDACGVCPMCRRGSYALCRSAAYVGFAIDGGFAEFAVISESCCHKLHPDVSYRAGALVEPLSVALHAVRRAKVGIGSRAAVIGGGAVGLCVLQALRAVGVREVYVIEKAEAKRRFAEELGASKFVDAARTEASQEIRELTDSLGVDVAFECVGSKAATHTAVEVTCPGGAVCLVGIYPGPFDFDFNLLMAQEKSFVASLGYADEFPTVIAMLADGRLKAEPLITRTLPLAEMVAKGLSCYEEMAIANVRTLIQVEA